MWVVPLCSQHGSHLVLANPISCVARFQGVLGIEPVDELVKRIHAFSALLALLLRLTMLQRHLCSPALGLTDI